MVMNITGYSSTAQATDSRGKVNQQPAPESKAQNTQTAPESGNTASSNVSLSDAAQAIQKGTEQLSSDTNNVNEQRVAELKAAIDNGTYKIDYESTARNLFQIESQLD